MEKPHIILITGGCRSGKSMMAMQLARNGAPRIFIATAEPRDAEMTARIGAHRRERDADWQTVEEPIAVADVLAQHPKGIVVVDCLTLWISNLLERTTSRSAIEQEMDALRIASLKRNDTTIFVSNEVGMGIVPENRPARLFRDLAGVANQKFAAAAEQVIWMISGLPLCVKGEKIHDFHSSGR